MTHTYLTALSRLLNYKKYPLYRIIPLRFIFLHILLLAVLMSLPAILHFSSTISSVKQLIAEKESDIPAFQIEDGQLKLKDHHTAVIHLNSGTISFTEQEKPVQQDIITFTKHHVFLQNMEPIAYQNIAMLKDKTSMIDMLKTYTQSSFFYLALLSLFLIAVQFAILTLKIMFVSFAAHMIAVICRKKSRYMNWLKIVTMLITIPTLIQFIDLLISNALLNPLSWCIMIVLICSAVYALPKLSNSN